MEVRRSVEPTDERTSPDRGREPLLRRIRRSGARLRAAALAAAAAILGAHLAVAYALAGGVEPALLAVDGALDPADRERIFEPFYRVQRPGAAAVPGSGLGLAVARRLTELQRGRLWAEEGAGSGSRFCVQLPAHVGDRAGTSAQAPASLAPGGAHSGVR